jgi:hypothetical protein
VAVWLGNASGDLIEDTGGGLPCNYLLQINQSLYEQYQEEHKDIPPFEKPSDVVSVSLDAISYYDTHTMLLADERSPIKYRIEELFAKHAVPSIRSDVFSNPRIATPTIKYEDGRVLITFDTKHNRPYLYEISRYDYATHTTVYNGALQEIFIDENVEKNKRYVYTVTPYFQDIRGKSIRLPEISTQESIDKKDREMINKDWWEE